MTPSACTRVVDDADAPPCIEGWGHGGHAWRMARVGPGSGPAHGLGAHLLDGRLPHRAGIRQGDDAAAATVHELRAPRGASADRRRTTGPPRVSSCPSRVTWRWVTPRR